MRDELALLGAQLTYKKRMESVLKELRAQEAPLARKVAELEQIMLQEKQDVDRLEGHSLAAFVYYALGRKEEKLDAERREFYAARVKHDAAARELASIRQDIQSTEEDLADLQNCESLYAEALERKRIAIEGSRLPESARILARGKELNTLRCQIQEVEEAAEAGAQALHTLHRVSENLMDIESWNTIDSWGGGKLADMAKHETLDDAQQNIEQLQIQLQKFNRELCDVTIRSSIQPQMEELLKFSASFFDNLFTEEPVTDRLKQARHQLEQTRDYILGILRQLQTLLEHLRHRYQRGKEDLDLIIVNFELHT